MKDELNRRRETWGDDPEEVEASQTVAEFGTDVEVQRAWHEHPTWVPIKVVWRFIARNSKRVGITIVGFVLLVVAVVIIPVPGPWSILLAIVALSILGTEYVWARKMLNIARAKADQAKAAVLGKKQAAAGAPDAASVERSGDPEIP